MIGALILSCLGFVLFLNIKKDTPKVDDVSITHPSNASLPQSIIQPIPASAPVQALSAVPNEHSIKSTLPTLAKSDKFVYEALSALMSNRTLMKLVVNERIIRNIVVTTINLTQLRAPRKDSPFTPPAGNFLTVDTAGKLTTSPENELRYTQYVKFAEAVDAKKLIDLYIRLYPLLQEEYKNQGYSTKSFNDLVIDTLDDLLETPDISQLIVLIQPIYFFLFSDTEIEDQSVGQKIMLRLGYKNRNIVKSKLREIKKQLQLHSGELKDKNN